MAAPVAELLTSHTDLGSGGNAARPNQMAVTDGGAA